MSKEQRQLTTGFLAGFMLVWNKKYMGVCVQEADDMDTIYAMLKQQEAT